jgi:hypothetical protein
MEAAVSDFGLQAGVLMLVGLFMVVLWLGVFVLTIHEGGQ